MSKPFVCNIPFDLSRFEHNIIPLSDTSKPKDTIFCILGSFVTSGLDFRSLPREFVEKNVAHSQTGLLTTDQRLCCLRLPKRIYLFSLSGLGPPFSTIGTEWHKMTL